MSYLEAKRALIAAAIAREIGPLILAELTLDRDFDELAGRARQRDYAAVGSPVDSALAQHIELSHHPESDNCEVMIERVSEPYSRTLHDDKASCVDS